MHDYRKEMAKDIRAEIEELLAWGEITIDPEDPDNRDQVEQLLQDEFWAYDNITGNGDGGYYADGDIAKTCVTENIEECIDALKEFCVEPEQVAMHFLEEDWGYFDCAIRCYLLRGVLETVLDGYYEEEK